MRQKRVSITIDKKMEEILRRNREDNEPDATCLSRLLLDADGIKASVDRVSLLSERNLDETRRMIGTFLEKVKQPFDQISDRLLELERLIKEKK